VFDPAFTGAMEARFYGRPAWERPDLWFVALAPERAELRAWIDDEVSHLAEPGRTKLVARLRDDANFLTGYHELATAAVFRDAGLPVVYEPDLDGLTPDLLVPAGPDGRPILVEVWTRGVPREVKGERRSWQVLLQRIAEVPVPVGLLAASTRAGALEPPTSGQAKQIAHALRRWLLGWVRTPGDVFEVGDYRFQVFCTLPGLSARLAPPTRGGTVDTGLVVHAISEKVSRYRRLATKLDAHLVVVAAAHPSAPLSLELLRQAIDGCQSFAFSFSVGLSGSIGEWSGKMLDEERPARFDPTLSAVSWLEAGTGDPYLTLIPVHTARTSLPVMSTPRIRS
jgi:hypothetical protein